jgi:hypothetical protein
MSIGKSSLLLALACGIAAAGAARADMRDVTLATDGTVYQVRADLYGKLFPQGKETTASNPVVALDVTAPDGPARRLLVPSTAGPDLESLPSVLFADDSQTVFLLWRTEFNFHPLLQLAAYDGRSWSKVIQVTGGNPFADKTSPQFTITRDTYVDTAVDGTETTHHLFFLHLIWQEQNGAGQLATFYTPIVISDGAYIGWNPIYNLDDFLSPGPSLAAAAAAPSGLTSLVSTPMLQGGPDSRTVVVVYTSASTARMAAIEVDVLPRELGQLAEKARAHIVDLGRKSYPADYSSLAEAARAHIVDLGVAFQPQVISSIADRVKDLILAEGAAGSDLLVVAEKARAHIVDLGAQLSGWGLRPSGNEMAKILEIGDTPNPVPPTDGSVGPASYLFQFRVSANLPAPQVGAGTIRLFASETGENLIVSWAQSDRLLYRNSRADGTWSDPKQLVFSNNLDLAKAYQILDQRLRNH